MSADILHKQADFTTFLGCDQQMNVIGHQYKGMYRHPVFFTAFFLTSVHRWHSPDLQKIPARVNDRAEQYEVVKLFCTLQLSHFCHFIKLPFIFIRADIIQRRM